MIKKTITYTDYNDETRTEDFYFHLNKAELIELENSVQGGLSVVIEKIIKEKDNKKLIELFKEIICKAYGEKSPDGRRFIKNEEVLNNFIQTEAYSELFMELAEKENAAAEFINGLMPAGLEADLKDVDVPEE